MGSSRVSLRVAGLFRIIFSTFCRRVIISTLLEVEGAVVERFARDSIAKRNAPTSPCHRHRQKGTKTIRVKTATDLVQINVHVFALVDYFFTRLTAFVIMTKTTDCT